MGLGLMFKTLALRLSAPLLIAASLTADETVVVRSGNGPIGGTDSEVTFLLGPPTGNFGHAFTPSDFSNVQSGPAAFIVNPNPLWIPGLSADASAQWIGTNSDASLGSGNTALYGTSFQINSPLSSATITLSYAADDGIGEAAGGGPNTGIYLNGVPVCGTSFPIGFSQEHTVSCSDIGPVLRVGSNWLYIEDGNAAGPAGLLFSATITTVATPNPQPSIIAVVNAASFVPGSVSPGSIAAVFGSFPLNAPSAAPSVPWPISLSGLTMAFSSGVKAPLVYASDGQVNIQIPWELAGQTQTSLTATANGQTSAPQMVSIAPSAPGIFSANGQAAILDASYRLVDASNPATPGSTILIYCTGLGAVTNQPADGAAARSNPLSTTLVTPTVTIGDLAGKALFSGLAPGFVGVYQVNVKVPASAPTGNAVPVALSFGGVTSNTVTMAIQSPVSLNPQPSITNLSPSPAQAGSSPLTLTINGSGFISSSSVTFNGASHTVSFVNSGQLTITLSTSDLATAGSFPVVVTNPPPGGGASNAVSFTVTAAETSVTGTWQGSWASNSGTSGSFGADLSQSGNTLTGGLLLLNSSCFVGGKISGTITGNSISLGVLFSSFGPTSQVLLTGTVDANGSGQGEYSVQTGPCAGDSGTFSLTKVPGQVSIAGTWQGTWLSITGANGSVNANITQMGNTLTVPISLSGSPCFSTGTAPGIIIASDILLGAAFGTSQIIQVYFEALVGASGSTISGQYAVVAGACTGDYGTFSVTKMQ